MLRASLIAMVALLAAQAATAEDDCACADESKWTGSYTGSVRQDGRWMFVRSTDKRCSRVEWTANDVAQATLVKGRENIHEWTGQPDRPTLAVQSCKVCTKERKVDDDSGSSAGEDSDGEYGGEKPKGGLSPFQGMWVAEGEDVFGAPVPYELELKVNGKEITGSLSAGHFEGDRGKAAVSGSVQTLNTAVIMIHAQNFGRTRLRLLDHRTLEMDWGLRRVNLERR